MNTARKTTTLSFTLAFALALALALTACGGNAPGSASSAASDASASASATSSASGSSTAASGEASASSDTQSGELAGKPWVTSIIAGNLPAERPELKDDLYTYYNYDFLAAHQSDDSSQREEHAAEVPVALHQIIQDESKSGHDLEQLRIFYNQATDLEALKAAGLSELQPYLDRIDAVASIDEMNALLTAEDFPFSPFIMAGVTVNDTRSTNIVGIGPELVLFDPQLVGGIYYQETDNPQQQAARETALQSAVIPSIVDLIIAGVDTSDLEERRALAKQIIDFEKAHGQYIDSQATYLKADYGAMADMARESSYSLDELCDLAANFPMKGTLEKLGKAHSDAYVTTRAWIEAFNGLWTAENLDAIKLVTKAKILSETRPYCDPAARNAVCAEFGLPGEDDLDVFAYKACDNLNTFSQVMAKAYFEEELGEQAKRRLTELSQNLIDEYKALVDNTPWMGEESQKRIIEKLEHITLNVLEPAGGYLDYSGVTLTPTDQGGTLLSNYLKLKQHRWECESKMIGAPAVAASSWFTISPLNDNAFYDPTSNSINILPGYMTSSVYRDDMDDAELLACIGFTIGHEISHGFDYTGSQIDAYGQPNPVFTDADVDSFVLKTTTLATYFKGIELEDGLFVDGQNVAGEAAADLCGMQINLELAKKIEGFDYDKYFRSIANAWAEVHNEPTFQQLILDNHPTSNLRINVNAQMFDPIYDVFGVTEGDGMYLAPAERIHIWGPSA